LAPFLQDARFALRVFRHNPAIAAVSIFTLAVGIGANTAIFSVANAVLLRQLPYPEPERLALISYERIATGERQDDLSWPRFTMIRDLNQSFSGIAAFTAETFNLTGRDAPEQIKAARVSWNFFPVLDIQPAAGRWFLPEEDKPGGASVVVLTHQFWERHFGANASLAGQTLTLNDAVYKVIAVLPPGFRFDYFGPVDLYAPRVFDLSLLSPAQLNGGAGFLSCLARLRTGVSLQSAQAEMNTLAAQYRGENPRFPDADPGLAVRVGNLRDEMVSSVRTALWILFGAVGLVLLIACANVASLLLSRALGRSREIAVRTALGATRADIVRQLLTESVLLASCGGIAGAALGSWLAGGLAALAGETLPRSGEIHLDPTVLVFTALISLAAGVLFGLAPAWQVSRPDVNSILRAEGRGATSGPRRNVLRNLLVIGQVALSKVLLIGAGLLVRSFAGLRGASPGFDTDRLLTMQVSLPGARYPRPAMAAFYRQAVANIRVLPGIRAAAGATALPLNPTRFTPALPEGQPQVPLAQRPLFNVVSITPGYAAAMRIPLIEGREFTDRDDTADAPKVVMVNRALTRRFWPGQNAAGKHIWVGRDEQPRGVIGVLGDVHNLNLAAEAKPELDLPYAQLPGMPLNLIVRTQGDPHTLAKPVAASVFALDREQPVTAMRTMDEIFEAGAAQPRFTTSLLAALALSALILAVVGIYGAIAYSVAERTQEMGIRMALGAGRADILRLVVGRGIMLAGAGIAIGAVASLALTGLLRSLLYRVSATDPLTFGGGAALFFCVALAASYIPARRATRVDPIATLR
jgi:putative ABC transport system permease protein